MVNEEHNKNGNMNDGPGQAAGSPLQCGGEISCFQPSDSIMSDL